MSKRFAVISGNIVDNVIVANNIEDAGLVTLSVCVEIAEDKNTGIGDTYDPVFNEFIASHVEPVEVITEPPIV